MPLDWETPKTDWVPANGLGSGDVNRIESNIQQLAEYAGPYAVTTNSGNAYTANPNIPITSLFDGAVIAVRFNVANTGAATINVSGLGARDIINTRGGNLSAGALHTNIIHELRYSTGWARWVVQSGGEMVTTSATGLTVPLRDSSGRIKAAAPSASDDVARKAETDALVTTVHNPLITMKNGTDLPATYPTGISVMAIANGLATGWPVDTGVVTTTNLAVGSDNRFHQTIVEKVTGITRWRVPNSAGTGWEAWDTVVSDTFVSNSADDLARSISMGGMV